MWRYCSWESCITNNVDVEYYKSVEINVTNRLNWYGHPNIEPKFIWARFDFRTGGEVHFRYSYSHILSK